MPFLPSDISIQRISDPRKFPQAVWKVLQDNPRAANVILPQALEAKEKSNSAASSDWWIICSTNSEIEFILSVTDGPLGPHPVFIFTPLPFDHLVDDYIRPCIRHLVVALAATVPTSRVFSIFSVQPVTRIFAEEWTPHTGVGLADNHEYYAAKISYCTIKTLRYSSVDESQKYVLRPAVHEDIEEVGELCYRFASTSEPFTLTEARAQQEAINLVEKGQVWVHEAKKLGGEKEIASIVAFTRNSDRVAAITKVHTKERWLRNGYAKRLVHKVCEHLLTGPNCKESVVLYVGNNNKAARVYDHVGFVGLTEDSQKVQGIDPWLELGFDREKVNLGHW
ncbi:hypothetical protein J132_02187 [Termitomyces sp. J132]|nr:hypothetical protein H2248_004487 [Termitomyces sp. 'cryptogamus']KNZ81235.1 hypothetical protein J132_02187 [Termitomyces sp. J132]